MGGTVRRYLAVQASEKLWRFRIGIEHPGRPALVVKDAGDERQLPREVRSTQRDEQRTIAPSLQPTRA
jgi:hypothetical protein